MRKSMILTAMLVFIFVSAAWGAVHKLDKAVTVTLPNNWQVETYKAGERGDGKGTSMLLNGILTKQGESAPSCGIAVGIGPGSPLITQERISAMKQEDITASSNEIQEGVSGAFGERGITVTDWRYSIEKVNGKSALHWTFTARQSQGEMYMEQYQIPSADALVNLTVWCRADSKGDCLPTFRSAVGSLELK